MFTTRTRLGTAMRSTAMDREAAALMGVDINRAIAITFFIGAALAGAAGVVQTQYLGNTVFRHRLPRPAFSPSPQLFSAASETRPARR